MKLYTTPFNFGLFLTHVSVLRWLFLNVARLTLIPSGLVSELYRRRRFPGFSGTETEAERDFFFGAGKKKKLKIYGKRFFFSDVSKKSFFNTKTFNFEKNGSSFFFLLLLLC